jgi:hypothetical protein
MCEWVKQQAAGEKVDDVGGWVTDERGNKIQKKSFRKLQREEFSIFSHTSESMDGPCKKSNEVGWTSTTSGFEFDTFLCDFA